MGALRIDIARRTDGLAKHFFSACRAKGMAHAMPGEWGHAGIIDAGRQRVKIR